MHLDPFELYRPTTVDETVALAGRLSPDVDYLAGGTDLLPNYKMRLNVRANLIALEDVSELRGISLDRVGAMVRLADLEADGPFAAAFPGVVAAAREVATPLVRASGTVGGNLLVETRCFFFNQSLPWRESLGYCLKADGDRCHVVPQKVKCYATFSGDVAPSLAVLDAEVEVAGPTGRRRVPVANLYDLAGDGIRRHHLGPGELIVAIHFPPESRGLKSTYRKLRIRPSYDFPELGVAVAARQDADGRVTRLALSIGGLETYPRRFDDLTAPLVGTVPTEASVRSLAEAVQKQVRPVHNTFLAPEYRKKMTGVFVRRATAEILGLPGAAA
jgi:4-hydroxybenzoyl-CoA reductase subunit beta